MPPRPGTEDAKIIFLAGAVAWWWDANWDSPQHYEYLEWRNQVRTALIAGGFLTYAHYEAFKGTWNPVAQKINDYAITQSHLFLILTPDNIPSEGTDKEVLIAKQWHVPVLTHTSDMGIATLLPRVYEVLT
jgi:hypothetical protein